MNTILLLSSQPWVERLGWTLVHFLWQGALVAAAYAVLRAIARCSTPQRRYLLACAALAAMTLAPIVTWTVLRPPVPDAATHSMPAVEPHLAATGGAGSLGPQAGLAAGVPMTQLPAILPWIVLAWLAGAIFFSIRLAGGWLTAQRLRSRCVQPAPAEWQQTLNALAARLRVTRPVRLLISAAAQTPAVIGWIRPIILIPAATLAGLPADQLEALLLHELAHIRRADYLVGILQSIAEALLFYHPAVWWISDHIRAEREHCCDDIAVAATGDVLTYARALANLETFRLSPVYAAANGGSLVNRIARLLGRPRPASRAVPGPAALASAALLATATLAVFAQPAERPKFEVASVKPSTEQRFMAVRPLPGGRLTATAPVRLLVTNAFQVAPYQVAGGPAWIDNDRYMIDAKANGNPSKSELMQMLQSLLEDRFQLKIHREDRELPVYALVPGKGGPKLPPPKPGECAEPSDIAQDNATPPRPGAAPCGYALIAMGNTGGQMLVQMLGNNVPISELTKMLGGALGRSVIDRTGFTGRFDLHLSFTPDMVAAGLPAGAVPAPDPSGAAPPADMANPSLLTAVQEQLGLKLESTKGPVEVVVIDHVEKPTAN